MLAWHCLTLREDKYAITLWTITCPDKGPPPRYQRQSSLRQELPAVQFPGDPMVPRLTRLSPAVTPWKKKLVRRWGRYPGYVIIIGEDQKKVHLWNTSKCSLPFSPGERDTTTWRCHFLSAKVLIKIRVKVLPKDCSSLYVDDRASTQIIWPMLLTEQNKFHSM